MLLVSSNFYLFGGVALVSNSFSGPPMRPEVFVWGCVFPCRDVVYLAFYSTYGTSNPPTGDIQEQAANKQRTGNEQGRPSQICHGQGDLLCTESDSKTENMFGSPVVTIISFNTLSHGLMTGFKMGDPQTHGFQL